MDDINKKEIVVIYHGNCLDGFTSSYIAWKKFGDNATYFGATDRQNPPPDLEGKEVYIIDYSYPLDVMLSLQEKAKKLVVIDHHVSAENDVKSLDNYVFDNNHSGAYLAMKYFFPEMENKLVDYVEDSDLYKFLLPNSKIILRYISSVDFLFEEFVNLEADLNKVSGIEKIIDYGNLLLKVHTDTVKYYAERAEKVIFEGYEIYISNASERVASDLGHILAEKTDSFSLIYYYSEGLWKCSLRSAGKVDVSLIAQKYGGGGHHNASGFAVASNDHPLPFVTKINGIN